MVFSMLVRLRPSISYSIFLLTHIILHWLFWFGLKFWFIFFFCMSWHCGFFLFLCARKKEAMGRSRSRKLWRWRIWLGSDLSLAGFIARRVWAQWDRADQQRVVLLNAWGRSQSPQKRIQARASNLNIKSLEKIQHLIILVPIQYSTGSEFFKLWCMQNIKLHILLHYLFRLFVFGVWRKHWSLCFQSHLLPLLK